MNHPGTLVATLLLLAPTILAQQPAAITEGLLRPVDSVRITENDSLFLARPFDVAVAPNGDYYVVDGGEAHVLQISPAGRILRVFGRKGRGPGELERPSHAAIGGDSLLAVMDNGQQRVVVYSLATGRFRTSFLLPGWLPTLQFSGGALLAGVLQVDSGTALVRYTTTGQRLGSEGVLPPVIQKHPALYAGFGGVTFTETPDGVFAVFEVSPSVYHWDRGSRTAETIPVPTVRRKGVRPGLFEDLLRDPSKARDLAYDRSVPIRLSAMGAHTLGFLTQDGRLEKTGLVGTYALTVIDLARRRACADIPIPAPQSPRPLVTFVGDTVIVLQQADDARGQPAAFLRRYVVRTGSCDWRAIPSSR